MVRNGTTKTKNDDELIFEANVVMDRTHFTCLGPNQPSNFTHGKEYLQDKQLESDITFHVGKQEAELALTVNNVVFNRDLYQLKGLIRARADPNKTDYDGRSPLHLAASRGYEDITLFLMQEHSMEDFVMWPKYQATYEHLRCGSQDTLPKSKNIQKALIYSIQHTSPLLGGLDPTIAGEKLKYGDRC
ncbi:hypothetical protein JHK82_044938 [Glycine max]|nr:hypothetical protein JHK82_044938 [Glycine max]